TCEGFPNLPRRIFADGLTALATMKMRKLRPEEFHVIANFGHGADGRTRGLDGVALFDGDGGWDAVNAIHLRFVHAIEELSGVRREGFDVTPLAFGIKRVKGE